MAMGRDARGFSVVELVVASALLLVVVGVGLRHVGASDSAFDTQNEAADMQQRLRAALDAVQRDLADAGAAGALGATGTALTSWAPAVWPMRLGLHGADPPGTVRADVITMLTAVPLPAVASTAMVPVAAQSGGLRVTPRPGCPPLSATCGLEVDTDVLVADGEGAFDLFTITDVTPPTLWIRHNMPDSPRVYPVGSVVMPVRSRTYYVRQPSAGRPPQLVKYEGGSGSESPVVDHVVALRIDYLGEPEPPRTRRPLSDPDGPWTTYGPRPPVADASVVPHVSGDSCLFAANGTALGAPKLATLGPADGPLVPLTPAQLTDGPWCPDAFAPNRYDADLLRIRSVQLTIRVEAALDALRGPAGLLFARAGSALVADRYAPDIELRARITPRNLVLGR